jgi:5'-nucleotidase (lipoprotein e(P4) family)
MKRLSLWLLAACTGLMFSCSQKAGEEKTMKPSCCETPAGNEHLMLAVLFHQKSAEMKAMSYQAYNLATLILDKDLADPSVKKKRAVVLDIDETVLDNSPYEAKCITDTINYPEKWDEWCNLGKAEVLPGAEAFLNYAVSKGVEIFYVTNRKESFREGTVKNLKEKNLPMADDKHVLMRTEQNSKEERRQSILKDYHIVMLIGDNLADFHVAYDGDPSVEKRAAVTDSLKAEFGKRFIVLPNAMYGDWEMALYGWNGKKPAAEKDADRRKALVTYE